MQRNEFKDEAKPNFFNEFRDISKLEEEHLTSVWNYFSNEPLF